MTKISAGLLTFRRKNNQLEVFLIHPGGPFFKNNDKIWGIPKGERHDAEDLLTCAKREFTEETGIKVPKDAEFTNLQSVTYSNGKIVHCWAFENDLPSDFQLKSNPSKFGWPENDQGRFFSLKEALPKIFPPQAIFLQTLSKKIKQSPSRGETS